MTRELFRDKDIKAGPFPAEVVAFWRKKGLKVGFDYRDVWKQEHSFAFTAAKVMRTDILEAMHEEIDEAISKGLSFESWKKNLEPRLKDLGWWQPHEVADPKTGKVAKVDPPRRLQLIYDTNMRTARAVGQWDRVQRTAKSRPYLLYQVGPSERHRPEHLAWHGLLLPVDDPFWDAHFPPCGWGCKCATRAVSKREADRLDEEGVLSPTAEPEIGPNGKPTGHVLDQRIPVKRKAPPEELVPYVNKRTGETEFVPKGVDPGFNYPPGQGREVAFDQAAEE